MLNKKWRTILLSHLQTKSINLIRTILVLFVLGATFGNLFNSFHAFSGTIPVTPGHLNPLLDWSSYLLFGFAGLAIGSTTLFFDKVFGAPAAPSFKHALGACAMLGVFYFITACMFLSNWLILAVLVCGFALMVRIYDYTWRAVLAAVLVALAGTAAEICMVHAHVYYYSRPQFMGVAYWLPFLYGIASIATGQLARAVNDQ